ncbi:hypothetical protein EDB83DRAFT_2409431 [Lactarius deliciosus]|nr:hypothetical protein EDB83DRAFT_2409431 [Lactarius deliciosus]
MLRTRGRDVLFTNYTIIQANTALASATTQHDTYLHFTSRVPLIRMLYLLRSVQHPVHPAKAGYDSFKRYGFPRQDRVITPIGNAVFGSKCGQCARGPDDSQTPNNFGDKGIPSFEHVTIWFFSPCLLPPLSLGAVLTWTRDGGRNLIHVSLLSADERGCVDTCHKKNGRCHLRLRAMQGIAALATNARCCSAEAVVSCACLSCNPVFSLMR